MKNPREMTYEELLNARFDCEERIASVIENLDDVRHSLAANENDDEAFRVDLQEADELLEDFKTWQGLQFDIERELLRSDTEHNIRGGHVK